MGKDKIDKRVFLVDGSSFIFRAFFALPHLSSRSGIPTNAVYGFVNMILKLIKNFSPTYLAVILDSRGKTKRHEKYEEYKANRPTLPEELAVQIPYIEKLIDALGIPKIRFEGYEADDVMATISRQLKEENYEIILVSGDKDLYQILDDKVKMYDPMQDKWITPAEVEEKLGIPVDKVTEYFALIGDSIDNVPGVPGIGKKGAKDLVREFGSLENIYANLEKLNPGMRKKLEMYRNEAFLSRTLVTLETSLPLTITLQDLRLREKDLETLERIFRELGFSKLLTEFFPKRTISENFHTVLELKELEGIVKRINETHTMGIDLETTSLDPHSAEIVGISLCWNKEEAFYIPTGHVYLGAPRQISLEDCLSILKSVLEDSTIKKYGQNLKYDYLVLKKYGIELKGIEGDSMIASYLLNPEKRQHNLDELAVEYLGHKTISYKELMGNKKIPFYKINVDKATKYSCEDVIIAFTLCKELEKELEKKALTRVYQDVELPLIEVLAHMEWWGIKVETARLEEAAQILNQKMNAIREEIYKLAGIRFNVDSPAQLREILYEKLKLPKLKKRKTGYSTDSEVLQQLASTYPICARILEYRGLAKLKNSYTLNLVKLVNPKTGRIHTSFNQTVTATGRLSSSEPNLQNIPVKGEESKMIRSAFVPEEGHIFISADYSQIELRILAHLSDDSALIEAFNKGEDIHTSTACQIFGVKPEEVTPDMRRTAKTINFGIIYGISPHGLSKELGTGHKEAKKLIEQYFSKYSGVKRYIEKTLERARKTLEVRTILGRVRPVSDINSASPAARGFAERVAVNAPVQGSAADIIKIAMINIFRRIKKKETRMKMLVQVHDELLFEVPENEVEKAEEIIKEEMENAYPLKVPLKVEVGKGKNWSEAKT